MYTTPPSSVGPSLPTLATELVELVSHCLEGPDLLSLRLVCKELHQKSLCAFGALFNTIRTDLSQTSFQRLRAICSHEMHLYVKKLLIEPFGYDGRLGHGVRWRRHSSDHLDMLSPGPQTLQHLLVHNLPNCRSFHMRSPGGIEDESDPLTFSHAVGLILLLIPSLPTTSPVNSFIVDCRALSPCDLDPTKLPMAQCRQPSFCHAWAHVQELVLDHNIMPATFAWTLDLVLHAARLRTLSLQLGFDRDNPLTERLCTADSTPRFLESLSLARGHTTMAQLLQLVEQSRGTLRSLYLWNVSISRFSDWPIVLERLRSQAPLLESISVNWLRAYEEGPITFIMFPSLVSDHVVPGSGGRSVTWMTKNWKGEKRIFRVSYRGPGVCEALGMLVRAAEVI